MIYRIIEMYYIYIYIYTCIRRTVYAYIMYHKQKKAVLGTTHSSRGWATRHGV